MRILFIVFLLLTLFAKAQTPLETGMWRATLQLNDTTLLPFNFEVIQKKDSVYLNIINDVEKICVDEIAYKDDSIIISLPVFNTEIRAEHSENELTGYFYNNTRLNKNKIMIETNIHKVYTNDTNQALQDE